MEQLDLLLKTLQQKILQLIKQNQFLKKQNETLITANSENEKKLAEKEMHLRKLESQLESMKFNASMLQQTDKKTLEKRIDTYLRDIEKCLAQLNA
ncbi:MAG TPA: hypothetical protein PKM63_21515 [Panacibacter sp.]|nr:hypothetical protein [Panacibacter sp.]HNP46891.1 hypothetical protein [Panacibacter sp.]